MQADIIKFIRYDWFDAKKETTTTVAVTCLLGPVAKSPALSLG
jgi:hypothetical protein